MRKRKQRIRQMNKFTCHFQFHEHATCKLQNSRKESELLDEFYGGTQLEANTFAQKPFIGFFEAIFGAVSIIGSVINTPG